ncbi:hypothetical protein NEUTE1DRAFT_70014, partial [Neurospora tetrasperma FGSC 2508]
MYIENRTAGKAAQDLEPYLGDGPHCLKNSQQLLDHLKNEYYDHNRKEKAILEFNELKFKMNEDFQEFRNAFVRLAGECNRPAETWKQEFNWKLPTDIQNALLFGYGEDTVDFTAFVRMAKKCVENSQRLWKSKHKDNKGKDKDKGKDNKNTSSKARGSSSSSSSAAKGSGSQRPPNMSKEEAR